MNDDSVRRLALPAVAFALAAAVTILGATSAGLWDPLELDRLEIPGAAEPPLGPTLVDAAQRGLGALHAAGRLPIALFGLLTAALTYALARLATDARGASYAVLLLVGTPILVLNSRLLLGESIVLLAQATVAYGAFSLVALERGQKERARIALGALALGAILAAWGSGFLLGLLPGVLAAATVAWIGRDEANRRARIGLTAAAALLVGLVGLDIVRDAAEYRMTLGGAPRGDQPSAFHHFLEVAFHGLGPLAALGPLGATWFFLERRASRAELLARFAMLWAAFSYGASVVFEARYGVTTFAAAPALAVLVALVLRARDDLPDGSRLAAIVVALFVGLLARDALLFPASAFDALPVRELAIPEDVDLRRYHVLAALLFLAVALPVLTVHLDDEPRSLSAPYRALAAHWAQSKKAKAKMLAAAALFVVLSVLGLLGLLAPDALPIRSIVLRGAGVGAIAIAALPIVVALSQLGYRFARRLGDRRHGALALAAAAYGLLFAFGALPTISRAFSPREVFTTLAAHRGVDEPLYVLEAAERSVTHYAEPPIVHARTSTEVGRALASEGRVWAIFPKAKLAEVNRVYRGSRRDHLVVIDDDNPLALLVTNGAVAGAEDRNPLRPFVSKEPPEVAHRVDAKLRGGYELVGWEIDGNPAVIRPGERFTLRLVWRATQRSGRKYEVFVHLDGPGGRAHGDHEPVHGLYPTQFWDTGDVVVDEVSMRVPAHYAPGTYTFYVGLYQGSQRAEVLQGNKDSDNRIVAGKVEVR